ncbi:MAG: hypothetical protein AAB345_03980 [Patescibacteria group bacterium]
MRLRPNALSGFVLIILAVLLIIGLRYLGVTGRLFTKQASFVGFSEQDEECLVGVSDPERASVNLAATGFTCADSIRFVYNRSDSYTSPLVNGKGFKLTLPAGWSVDEKAMNGAGVWLTFSKFSAKENQYIAGTEKFRVFDGKPSVEESKQGIYVFGKAGPSWFLTPALDFAVESLERIGE